MLKYFHKWIQYEYCLKLANLLNFCLSFYLSLVRVCMADISCIYTLPFGLSRLNRKLCSVVVVLASLSLSIAPMYHHAINNLQWKYYVWSMMLQDLSKWGGEREKNGICACVWACGVEFVTIYTYQHILMSIFHSLSAKPNICSVYIALHVYRAMMKKQIKGKILNYLLFDIYNHIDQNLDEKNFSPRFFSLFLPLSRAAFVFLEYYRSTYMNYTAHLALVFPDERTQPGYRKNPPFSKSSAIKPIDTFFFNFPCTYIFDDLKYALNWNLIKKWLSKIYFQSVWKSSKRHKPLHFSSSSCTINAFVRTLSKWLIKI